MTTWNKNFLIVSAFVFIGLLYVLAPILTPFLVGAILAYLGNPIVERLMRFRLPRIVSVMIVFLLLFMVVVLCIVVIVPLIEKQLVIVANSIPAMMAWAQQTLLPWVKTHLGIDDMTDMDTLKSLLAENWTKAGGIAAWLWKTVLASGFTLIAWIANCILIPVVTFYLLRDWEIVLHKIRDGLPRAIAPTVIHLAKSCDQVLSAFFRGQLLVMIALGIIYALGLTVIGLQVGVIVGFIAGLASIVPYLGFIVGVTAASIAALLQFGTWTSIIGVLIVFAIGQALEGMVLTPKLVGSRIGLHPVAVIFAVLAGGTLCGFFGVLLALPAAAVIMVLLRYMNQQYRSSELYRNL